jgi:hypothetical protein
VINPPPETAPVWKVAELPELEIGSGKTRGRASQLDPSYVLYEVNGAARLSNGTIVVVNQGTRQVRFYASHGQLLVNAGGPGDGPGEFVQEMGLVSVLPGDSVVALDVRHRLLRVYDRTGQLVQTRTLSSALGLFPIASGVLDDGSMLLRPVPPDRDENGVPPGGVRREVARVVVAGNGGVEGRMIGDYPGGEGQCLPVGTPGHGCRASFPLPFGRRFFSFASRDRIALANSDSFSVRIVDARGTPIHVVRQRREPMEVRRSDDERARSTLVEYFPDRLRPEVQRAVDAMPHYATFPAFADVRLDRDGELWVEESRRPGDDQPVWQVFDRDGVLIGRVETPVGLAITDIGADYLVGVWRDALDVERVRLYRYERATPPSRTVPAPS